MQEIESAVRDLGGSAMQGIDHAVKVELITSLLKCNTIYLLSLNWCWTI